MTDVACTAASVRPLDGCVIRRFTAGGTITLGSPVYLSAADTIAAADGSAFTGVAAIGIAVAVPSGATSATSGDSVDVVLFGPVTGYTDAVYGTYYYVDDDAGVISDTAGTKDTIIGIGLNATTILVRVQPVDLS